MTTRQSSEILRIIRDHGLTTMPRPVQLASGFHSRYFIDGKAALADGTNLAVACRTMIDAVGPDVSFDAVGGLTLGADQFAHGIALLAPCQWFVIRKTAKGRGTNKRVEGATLDDTTRVLLVDDVVTTGGSIQEAFECVQTTGARVVAATTLVDRGDIAEGFFAAEGVPYLPLLTYVDLGIPRIGDEDTSDPAPAPT